MTNDFVFWIWVKYLRTIGQNSFQRMSKLHFTCSQTPYGWKQVCGCFIRNFFLSLSKIVSEVLSIVHSKNPVILRSIAMKKFFSWQKSWNVIFCFPKTNEELSDLITYENLGVFVENFSARISKRRGTCSEVTFWKNKFGTNLTNFGFLRSLNEQLLARLSNCLLRLQRIMWEKRIEYTKKVSFSTFGW